ncbi:MAG: ATP-binding protein [Myxococcales bacterium]|nr:ATP-binding protein [Myxococcales bacterium]
MDPLHVLEPAATRVRDPLSGRSVWLAGLIQDARIDGDTLRFVLAVKSEHAAEDRQRLREALLRNLVERGWTGEIVCTIRVEGMAASGPVSAQADGHAHAHAHGAPAAPPRDALKGMSGPGMQPHGGPITKSMPEGVKRIIAVTSGKGGVGKSTVATNLAVALATLGHKVGLLDADIYGPSLPLMMNLHGKPVGNDKKQIVPIPSHGVRCMSIGLLVDEKEPVIWRGPMVMGVVNQFFKEVDWSDCEWLIVDLPPGTGDAQLTMIQGVPISGGVVVTTPQPVALLDAVRGLEMFRKLDVPILGVVENMSWFELPGGGRAYPFGEGGGARLATEYGVPLLGQVPLRESIRAGGDAGRPAVLDGESIFTSIAQKVARLV